MSTGRHPREPKADRLAVARHGPSPALGELGISWCGAEAAPVVLELTRRAFAGQEALEPPSSATRETLEVVGSDLSAGRGVTAALGGQTVAVARVVLFDDHLHVRRLAVEPRFRRRGVASELMAWLHTEAAASGYDYVSLGVRKALLPNRELYEKLGYYEVQDHGFWVELRFDLHRPRGGSTPK